MQFLAAAAATEEEGGLIGHSSASILKKESVVRLGQRLLDMAEYISRELTPLVNDEFATLNVSSWRLQGHGEYLLVDYKFFLSPFSHFSLFSNIPPTYSRLYHKMK